jgi:serine/threonine-protein kinase
MRSDYAEAHCNLGVALRRQGQLSASRDSLERGHALGSKRSRGDWPYPSEQWLAYAERLVRWEAKLLDVLMGKATPADNPERLGLVQVCRLQGRAVAAAGLYADAFAADARLADDLKASHRYNAACCAVLAAAGQGIGADRLDDKERARWRKQAIAWLRADLDLLGRRLAAGTALDRQAVRATLTHWQGDADLVSIRAPEALKKLPAGEQEPCRKLWADVAALLKKAGPG